ncbi:hypothetical protein ACFYUD_03720 [Nocardia tengchongensis]|uniref:hypothetical protein n=1 Tax=Nocardia tengchongensis TaxID=2055889 RepID=UPI0036BC9522
MIDFAELPVSLFVKACRDSGIDLDAAIETVCRTPKEQQLDALLALAERGRR